MLQKNLIQKTDFYIDGAWRAPVEAKSIEVINPANEKPYAVISAGSAKDIDLAVAAARKAFPSWSETSAADRIGYIRRLVEIYEFRVRRASFSEISEPDDSARTDWRLRPHHALELANEPDRAKSYPCASCRLHRHTEAIRDCPHVGHALRRVCG